MARAYTTENELKFIAYMGRGLFSQCRETSRLVCLRRYRDAIDCRSQWDEIDRTAVLDYIDRSITNIVKKRPTCPTPASSTDTHAKRDGSPHCQPMPPALNILTSSKQGEASQHATACAATQH